MRGLPASLLQGGGQYVGEQEGGGVNIVGFRDVPSAGERNEWEGSPNYGASITWDLVMQSQR